MERQNVTLALPRNILMKAKAVAARQDKSLSEYLREALQNRLASDAGFIKAKRHQLALLKKGFNLGTKGNIALSSRNELHER